MNLVRVGFFETRKRGIFIWGRNMYSKLIVDKGGYMQEMTLIESPRPVLFPVYLTVKYGDNSLEEYHDFLLNVAESWVFVRTESPHPEGTSLIMHFYIPPEYKLLSVMKGKVQTMNQNNADYPKGMLIKFGLFSCNALKNLESYVEGKKHLIDTMI
jgi:hypothetical protein